MKQLSGVDASFLYMETATSFGHVSGLGIFSRPADPGWSPYDALCNKLLGRLSILEPLRRRLVEVPFQLDHPYWIEDPDFDLEYHIRESAVPPPGSDQQLATLVARLIGRPLDRAHPLWEAYVIEGLTDDRFAILTKLHHATIDGAAGAEMMTIMYDSTPDEGPIDIPDKVPTGERLPSPAEVLARALTDVARKPSHFARLQVRSMRALGELTRNQGLTGMADLARRLPNPARAAASRSTGRDEPAPPPATPAPATPINGAITPHRRLAMRSVPLADLKALKTAAEATLNDVVMAVCAGALRNYLLSHNALPQAALIAMVPVSIRTGNETDRWTNRVSSLFPPIPTDEADPLIRLDRVRQSMKEAKEAFALLPADMLTEYAQFAPPALAIRAAQMSTRLRVADRFNPPFNVVISNVPGPRNPLYLNGAKMLHYYPVSTITEGQGLNITLHSYCDTVDFGLVACRELVPDVELLADLLLDEIGVLADAVGLGSRRRKARSAS